MKRDTQDKTCEPAENDDWLLNAAEIDEAQNFKAPAEPSEPIPIVIGKEPAFLKGEKSHPRQEGKHRVFAANFRDVLAANGLAESKVADQTQVPLSIVQHWATGRSEPTLDEWEQLSELFGLPKVPEARRAFWNGMLFTPGFAAIYYRRQAQKAERRLKKHEHRGQRLKEGGTRQDDFGNRVRRQAKADPVAYGADAFAVAERIVRNEFLMNELCQTVLSHSKKLETTIATLQAVNNTLNRRYEWGRRCFAGLALVLVLVAGLSLNAYFSTSPQP